MGNLGPGAKRKHGSVSARILEGWLGRAACAWVPTMIPDPPNIYTVIDPPDKDSDVKLLALTLPRPPSSNGVGVQMGACELRFLSLGRGGCV